MTRKTLTDKQRSALEAVDAARSAGLGLGAYARANGLNARQIYDAVTGLRKRGLLPPTATPRPRRPKAAFVAVNVMSAQPTMPRSGMVCRLLHCSGLVIECGEWPPAGWLSSMIAERAGAAT